MAVFRLVALQVLVEGDQKKCQIRRSGKNSSENFFVVLLMAIRVLGYVVLIEIVVAPFYIYAKVAAISYFYQTKDFKQTVESAPKFFEIIVV